MKSTKKSLLLSVLSLVLCFVMLIGTTFAWFTDSVTSGTNRIVAGNLDVDMLYKSGTMTDYATVKDVVNNSDGTTPFFVNKDGGKVLWEPGAMVYTYFDVKNLGTLAFQYNFALRITGMNALETADVKHTLSEVVKAVVLDGEVAGDQIKTAVADKTWNSIESFEDKGSMLPDGDKKFTVVLYWEPTDHDNLYNVNNGQNTTAVGTWTNEDNNALYIDFDIQLTATQVPHESDSFDKFYDNIELGLIPAAWSGESEAAAYNDGGTYKVVVGGDTKASVEVPAGAKTEDGETLSTSDQLKLVVTPGADAVIKVETGNSMTTYDVSLVRVSDNKKVTSDDPMKVKLDVGFVDLIRFYHKGVQYQSRKTTADEVTNVGDFFYDVTTGDVTFMTKDFSPFTSVYKFAGGLGNEAHPYLIATREQMECISDIEKYSNFKWIGRQAVDASDWSDSIYLCGSFDGNGVTFNNLDCFLFRSVRNGSESWAPSEDTTNTYTIKNLTANVNISSSGWMAGIVRCAGVHNFIMENVTVHGYIEGATGVSPFVCFGAGNYDSSYAYDGNVTFKNCNSDATVVAKSGNAVGFVAHAMMKSSDGKIALVDSEYTGTMSATAASGCKYVVGNWCNATITDNQSATMNNTVYKATVNGYQYIADGKTGTFSVEQQDKPANIGDVFSVIAKTSATKAVFALQISPNPGNMTSTYMTEEVNLSDGTFTSSNLKYFTVRVNNPGATAGAHGNNFDVVYPDYNGTLGSNTIVRVTQYNASNEVVGITEINFHDVK